jgi:hypothetical protein
MKPLDPNWWQMLDHDESWIRKALEEQEQQQQEEEEDDC